MKSKKGIFLLEIFELYYITYIDFTLGLKKI